MVDDVKDVQGLEKKFDVLLRKLPNDKKLSARNKELILKYLHDGLIGKAGKKKISKARLYRSAGLLKLMANEWFKKDLDKVTDQDTEKFVTEIENGGIKNNRNKPYKPETKATILKFVKKYYRYLGKLELVSWIDTTYEHAVIAALTENEIGRIIDGNGTLRNKCIVQLLFDSGARIEEFLNLKYKDVSRQGEFYMLNLRISKTRPRIVSVGMKKSTELLTEWLHQNGKAKQDEFLFNMSYKSIRELIQRMGQKAINKKVFPHLFRHSSMTYYASKLKQYPFAKRYGLALNSEVVSRYIDLSGIDETETANIVKATRELEMEQQIKEMRLQINLLVEQQDAAHRKISKSKEEQYILGRARNR